MRWKALEIGLAVLLACAVAVGAVAVVKKQHTKIVTRTVVKTKKVTLSFSGPQSLAEFLGANGETTPCPDGLTNAVCFRFDSPSLYAFLAVPKP